ncbi:hypothetical protein [Luteimonas lutimaris]|uniref:Helix-turn-helix domain-containing protein n=1 Tax=Luteimonas lutimaris TaxID=698645 RepID=A0ABP7MR83_9GAMM
MSRRLLLELVDRCIAGDCDHATAAKLLGVRRARLDELVRQVKVKRRVHGRLVAAFHHAFPECNPRNYHGHPERIVAAHDRPRNPDNLLRGGPAAPCVTYTAEEAASLPPSQPWLGLLNPPGKASEWDRHPIGRRLNKRDEESASVCNNTNRQVEQVMVKARAATNDDSEPDVSGPEFEFAA